MAKRHNAPRSRKPAASSARHRRTTTSTSGAPSQSVNEQRNRQSSRYDLALTGVSMFIPKQGDNLIRILPPTWKNTHGWQIDKSGKVIEHYAYQVWMHKWIGPSNGNYLCLREMKAAAEEAGVAGGDCPCCDEWQALKRHGDQEAAAAMGPKEQWIFYLLDRRSDLGDKPIAWSISKMQDDEIVDATRGLDNEVIFPDNPTEGYDLRFRRISLDPRDPKKTRYTNYQFARDPSPMHDSPEKYAQIKAWLKANPIPNMLKFYSAEYMEQQLMGTARAADEALDDGGSYQDAQGQGDGGADDPRYAETQWTGDGQADQGGGNYDPEAPTQDGGDGGGGEYVEEALAEANAEAGEAAQATQTGDFEEEPVVDQPPQRPVQARRPVAAAPAPRGGNGGGTRPPPQQAPRGAAPASRPRPAPQPAPRGNPPQRPARR